MDILIFLVLLGMVLYFLPYIIAGAVMLIAIIGGLIALVIGGIYALFKNFR